MVLIKVGKNMEGKNLSEMIAEQKRQREKLTINIKECAELLGIGEQRMREIVHIKDFPAIKSGNRWLIVESKVEEWLINNIGKYF